MAILQPDHSDPGENRAATEAVGAPEVEERLVRDGRQVIARGSLVCPSCELPLPGRPAVAATEILHCGWCGHAAPARDLIRDMEGAPASRVELVARIGS